jgi:signal transduction histidine kinase
LTDWLVPVLLAVLATTELAVLRPDSWQIAAVVEVAACLCLVGRRRWPMAAGVSAGLLNVSLPWFGPQLDEVAAPILISILAVYSLARWIAGYRGLVGLAVILLALTFDYVLVDERVHNVTDIVFVTSLMLPPYIFGRLARAFAEQAAELERQQEVIRREAVRGERDRIARELHDVIAHSVSAMVVQTAAAQDLVRRDPDRAAGLLESIADIGRQALAETGRLLHLIRDDADELGLHPAPGLADLGSLLETFRAGGLDVDASIQLPAEPLAGGVDVSAYRVVQEALTNALKYGDDHAAALSINGSPTELHIRATNRLRKDAASGSGLGLLGMAERVALLGGRISHETRDGEFVLDVLLPLVPGGELR